MLTPNTRRIGNGAIDHIQLVNSAFLDSSSALCACSFPLRVTNRQDMYLTHSLVDYLRTSMVNCKSHIQAPSGTWVRWPSWSTFTDIITSSTFTDFFSVLRMDCIYLSQKFGRPLVRCFRAAVSFPSVSLIPPFSSPMTPGEEAQPSPFRVLRLISSAMFSPPTASFVGWRCENCKDHRNLVYLQADPNFPSRVDCMSVLLCPHFPVLHKAS